MKPTSPLLALSLGVAFAGALGAVFVAPAVHAQDETDTKATRSTNLQSKAKSDATRADLKTEAPTLPDLQPNQDWQRVEVASESGLRARAWSDPAAGCHLALFSLPIPDSSASDNIFESLSATLATSDYRLTKSESDVEPASLLLEGFGVRGIATMLIPDGSDRRANLLACYWNGREATYCRSICQRADEKMRALASGAAREQEL